MSEAAKVQESVQCFGRKVGQKKLRLKRSIYFDGEKHDYM
jgi:hypothetical protein